MRAIRSDLLDIAGHTFGGWLVLSHAGSHGGDTHWDCRCVCGKERRVKRASLISGRSKSCGCTRPVGTTWSLEQQRESRNKWKAANPGFRAAQSRRWRERDPERAKAQRRKTNYRIKYGLELSEVEAMHAKQAGRCAICQEAIALGGKGPGSAFVDHCHATGVVRGLLCSRCNTGLGQFRDSPTNLAAAMTYLAGVAG